MVFLLKLMVVYAFIIPYLELVLAWEKKSFGNSPISKDLIEIGMRIAMTYHQHLTLTKEAPHEAFD